MECFECLPAPTTQTRRTAFTFQRFKQFKCCGMRWTFRMLETVRTVGWFGTALKASKNICLALSVLASRQALEEMLGGGIRMRAGRALRPADLSSESNHQQTCYRKPQDEIGSKTPFNQICFLSSIKSSRSGCSTIWITSPEASPALSFFSVFFVLFRARARSLQSAVRNKVSGANFGSTHQNSV